MNKERRKRLEAIQDELNKIPGFDDMISELTEIMEEEQEAFDNMPEAFQNGDRGEVAQNAINCIQAVIDTLEAFEYPDLAEAIEG